MPEAKASRKDYSPLPAYIGLQAINLDKNIARYYNISITQDLFSVWVILINHGGIGFKGKIRLFSYSSFDEMNKSLKKILRKRSNSTTRIGCNYALTSLQSSRLPEIQRNVLSFWPSH